MKTYIAFLRAINVSGKNKILMKDLRELLTSLGLFNVETYIQSGNVKFETKLNSVIEMEQMISQEIKDAFQLEIEVFIRTLEELKHIKNNNPFISKTEDNFKPYYLTFLNDKVINTSLLDAFDVSPDEYTISNGVIYLKYVNGAGKTKLSTSLIERKLNLKTTARNWNTLSKVILKWE